MTDPSGEARARLDQQTALARFGEFALRSDDLDAILQKACELVSAGLGAELSKVMEMQPDGATLRVRAGTGWAPGIAGHLIVPIQEGSSDHASLRSGDPILVADMPTDDRYSYLDFVVEHQVKSFVNVNILGRTGESSFGILEVDSREPRHFSEGDVDFLRTYANLVAAAVERLRAFEELRRRAEEKDRLFAELQHRVKNNMQVITSLIRIQSSKASTPEAQEELQKIGFRIDTLRIIHEKLHATGQVEAIDVGAYLAELSATLIKFHSDGEARVRLVTDLEPFSAAPEIAVPLGLVTNEFITNSLKYAFGNDGGEIGVRLRRTDDGGVCVKLWDNGKGLPAERAGGTGMYLIEGLSRQIASEIAWGSGEGTELRLTLR